MQFYAPGSPGEWLAFIAAAVTTGFGLICLLMPSVALRLLRLQPLPGHPEALSESRATLAGFYLGLGLTSMALHPQPLLYLALGVAWWFTAFGRLVSIFADGGRTAFNAGSLVLEIALGAMAIAYALGYVA